MRSMMRYASIRKAFLDLSNDADLDLMRFQKMLLEKKRLYGREGRILLYGITVKFIDCMKKRRRWNEPRDMSKVDRNPPFVMPRIEVASRSVEEATAS